MLLVHDLMLLLLDDDSGRQRSVTALPALLAGALLVELAAAGLIDVDDRGRLIRAQNGVEPGDPMLADAARIAERYLGTKPDRALRALGKGVRERATADLVAAGILAEQRHRVLGIFPSTRHPAVSTAYEDDLRARLTATLQGLTPDAKTGPLIALLFASGHLPKIIPVPDRKQARAVAKAVSEGNWAAASVRRAVRAAQSAAVTAATTAATTAAVTN